MSREKIPWLRSILWAGVLLFPAALAALSPAFGAELDSRVFVVETGAAGENASDKDVYIFLNGKFLSTGFQLFHELAPGAFTERGEGDAVTFAAGMKGPSGETVRWEGTVQNGQIQATFIRQAPSKWYRFESGPKKYWARTVTATPEPVLPGREVSHVLDGKTFLVRTGAQGKPEEHADYLVFWDGKYVSSDCFPYGFGIAAYSTSFEGDGIRFHAETRSATQGRLIYDGIVRGDSIEVTSRWLHERWFWKIDREYWYKGSLFK